LTFGVFAYEVPHNLFNLIFESYPENPGKRSLINQMSGRKGTFPMMRFDRFTERAQEAAQRAAEIIQRYGHNQIDTEHILLA
jgi:hypothetical protein